MSHVCLGYAIKVLPSYCGGTEHKREHFPGLRLLFTGLLRSVNVIQAVHLTFGRGTVFWCFTVRDFMSRIYL